LEYLSASEVEIDGGRVHFRSRGRELDVPIEAIKIVAPKLYLPRRTGFIAEDSQTRARAWVLSDTDGYFRLLSVLGDRSST
jgi:hypothetical protein